jgi:hypothetical protein
VRGLRRSSGLDVARRRILLEHQPAHDVADHVVLRRAEHGVGWPPGPTGGGDRPPDRGSGRMMEARRIELRRRRRQELRALQDDPEHRARASVDDRRVGLRTAAPSADRADRARPGLATPSTVSSMMPPRRARDHEVVGDPERAGDLAARPAASELRVGSRVRARRAPRAARRPVPARSRGPPARAGPR